ncbi:MAG: 50S ribosomal protein L24e [Candidatus Micrarchaeota archaeon]
MATCSFCGTDILPGRGVTLYKRDGTGLHFCSRKCEVNTRMGRNPRKLKWTERFASTARKKKTDAAPAGADGPAAKAGKPERKKSRERKARKALQAADAAKLAEKKPEAKPEPKAEEKPAEAPKESEAATAQA